MSSYEHTKSLIDAMKDRIKRKKGIVTDDMIMLDILLILKGVQERITVLEEEGGKEE